MKEFGDGTAYLAAEPERSAMKLLDEAQMFFQLRSGMKIAQAQRVAGYLNEQIKVVEITLFEMSYAQTKGPGSQTIPFTCLTMSYSAFCAIRCLTSC